MTTHTPETVKAQMQADIDAANVKTGRTDETVHDAINALIAGYGQGGGSDGGGNNNDVINIYTSHSQFDTPWEGMPETIKLHLMVGSSVGCAMNKSETDKLLDFVITGETLALGSSYGSFTSTDGVVRSIDAGGAIVKCYATQCFRGQKSLERINAVLDFDGGTPDRTFRDNSALISVRFLPNNIAKASTNRFISWSPLLEDDSIISLANALMYSDASQTLALDATPKARCDEILGTVSQVTDEGGVTYDFFTVDPAGTVTLTEFITNTKGWTLA